MHILNPLKCEAKSGIAEYVDSRQTKSAKKARSLTGPFHAARMESRF